MKLLHCLACGDVVRLYSEPRACHCGRSRGHYVDDERVVLWGPSRAIGIDTRQLRGPCGTWGESDRVGRSPKAP